MLIGETPTPSPRALLIGICYLTSCACVLNVYHYFRVFYAIFRSIYICQVSSPEENTPLRCLSGHDDEVNAVCWSPGGELLASCSDDSTAKIWTTEEGLKYDLRGHLKEIFTLRWTPTGPHSNHPDKPLFLCTASFDGTVKVYSDIYSNNLMLCIYC